MVVNFATNDLGTFAAAARAAAALAPHYDVRLVVSHLARPNLAELRDAGDPYLRYSINFGGLFSFVAPEGLAEYLDGGCAAENLGLLERKMAVLRRLGMKGAFFGREPVYLPEGISSNSSHAGTVAFLLRIPPSAPPAPYGSRPATSATAPSLSGARYLGYSRLSKWATPQYRSHERHE